MSYPEKALRNHPGANPHRGQRGKAGYFRGLFYFDKGWVKGRKYIGIADASRWRPHYGAKEQAKYAARAPHRVLLAHL